MKKRKEKKVQKKVVKKTGEVFDEFGGFSNPKKEKLGGVFDTDGKPVDNPVLRKRQLKVMCNCCGFVGIICKFSASYSKWHDMRCAQCGSVTLDTSQIKSFLVSKYHFGNDNKLKIYPKDIKPEYGS
jgi:hypothetical protein